MKPVDLIRQTLIVSSIVACFTQAQASTIPSSAASAQPAEQQFAGEMLGIQVPLQNYYFVKAGVSIFGNKWGGRLTTPQEMESAVWDQLLLSLVAFNENITISDDELSAEVSKTLAAEGVKFDRKKDAAAYESWVKQKTNLSASVFEEELRHMMQLQKLREKVIAAANPDVAEHEARQKFLNENNSLSLELIEFGTEADAEAFYKRVKGKSALWEAEKSKRPGAFKRPGFVSHEFLIDLWGIPQDACAKMMAKNVGDMYPPRPIYKGYGVFKILEKRPADESQFAASRDSYVERVRNAKKTNEFGSWLEKLKKQAAIKVYPVASLVEQNAKVETR